VDGRRKGTKRGRNRKQRERFAHGAGVEDIMRVREEKELERVAGAERDRDHKGRQNKDTLKAELKGKKGQQSGET